MTIFYIQSFRPGELDVVHVVLCVTNFLQTKGREV